MGYCWPDGTNTGVPYGVILDPRTEDIHLTKAGTVLSGLDIRGTVYIEAANVTLENCKITSSNFAVVLVKAGITGAVVKNCDIDNLGAGGTGIAGQGTFIANNIVGCSDGIDVRGNNTVIQDNYIPDMNGTADSHFDGIQADGGFSNLTIRHNTIVNEHSQTSAIMLDNYWGPIERVVIDNNLLIGGGYTVYIGARGRARDFAHAGYQFDNGTQEARTSLVKGHHRIPATARGSRRCRIGKEDHGYQRHSIELERFAIQR